MPEVWKLTRKIRSRIFQHITVPDLLKQLFEGFNVAQELGDYEPREYITQYQESDFVRFQIDGGRGDLLLLRRATYGGGGGSDGRRNFHRQIHVGSTAGYDGYFLLDAGRDVVGWTELGNHPHSPVGQEVIVSFTGGDPDAPLVTGSVYNPDQMPPYTLPVLGNF